MEKKSLFTFIFFSGLLLIPSGSIPFTHSQEPSLDPIQSVAPEINYELKLKSRNFTPSNEIALESITSGLSEDEKIFFIMQFEEIPDAQKRTELKEQGIEIVNYISGNAYIASASVSDVNNVKSTQGLRFASQVNSNDKISAPLQERQIGDWARVQLEQPEISAMVSEIESSTENLVVVTIQFHKGVPIDHAKDLVSSFDGVIVGMAPIVPSVTAIIDIDKIQSMTEENTVQFIDQVAPPLQELNDGIRSVTGVNTIRNSPYGLTGSGSTVLVFDVGVVSSTHPDFTGRIIQSDPGAGGSVGGHATHVGGTVAGSGVNSNNFGGSSNQWSGMAPMANLRTFGISGSTDVLYDSGGDLNSDFTTAINSGIDIATMSLGNNVNSNGFPCALEGDYTNTAILIDNIVRGAISGQQLIFFEAAGNERQGSARCGEFSTIASPATAKNSIAVGAINSNDNSITSFTSFGPTDDGRLKPDVTAPGCQVGGDGTITSTGTSQNYVSSCGTSMATPATAGIAALLVEQWRQISPNSLPLSHTMKAILIHTSDDGGNAGPDYKFGWGSVNAQTAADLIDENSQNNLIRVDDVDQGQTQSYTFDSSGVNDVKVTLVWDDPPATRLASSTLINDIDLVLRDPTGVIHRPFVLDPNSPTVVATTGVDTINNVEMVIADAKMGTWEVFVLGSQVHIGPQQFSLIVPEGVTTIPPSFDIQGSTTPIDLSKSNGPTDTRIITIQGNNNFAGTINLSTSTVNTGFTTSISPSTVTLSPSSATATATLTVTFTGNPTVSSSVKVVGTSGSITDTLSIPITGGCLIATATYGSTLATQVQMLREIRDTQLLQTDSGTLFMEHFNAFYYTFSPTIAQWERDSPTFKNLVKITITPLITSLSILNHVDIDSESEMLGYGISLIILNLGMYVGLPMIGIMKLKKRIQ